MLLNGPIFRGTALVSATSLALLLGLTPVQAAQATTPPKPLAKPAKPIPKIVETKKPESETPAPKTLSESTPAGGPALATRPADAMAGVALPNPALFDRIAGTHLPAVVNISTTQAVKPDSGTSSEGTPSSPFDEFFKDFFDHQGKKGNGGNGGGPGGSQGSDEGSGGDGSKGDSSNGDSSGGDNSGGKAQSEVSLGSGFIVDASGLVVTNNHVIDGADTITVTLQDGTDLKATLVGRDKRTDLALLKVEPKQPLPTVAFGDSDAVRVGDWVMAVGNPFGLGGTVTTGILSARSRAITNNDAYDDFLQTDASINRGNSGGPLFNMAGQVIGINSAIFSPSGGSVGIGFAIPSNLARHVVEQLKTLHHAQRGWIGVQVQSLNGDAKSALNLPNGLNGVLVAGLLDKAPAAGAGIRIGDIITGIGGKPVTGLRRFNRLVDDADVGTAVPVALYRDGAARDLSVTVGRLDESGQDVDTSKPLPPPPPIAALGLSLATVDEALKDKYNLDDNARVVVVEVAKDAAKLGIKPGDVVVEAGLHDLAVNHDFAHQVEAARARHEKSLLVLLARDGDLRYIQVPLS